MAIIRGNDLSNTLSGTSGNDVIYGYGGVDVLMGDIGNDTLYGGSGYDYLYGGVGNDTFVFFPHNDYNDSGGAIFDFVQGSDKIELVDTWFASVTQIHTLTPPQGTPAPVAGINPNYTANVSYYISTADNQTLLFITGPDRDMTISVNGQVHFTMDDFTMSPRGPGVTEPATVSDDDETNVSAPLPEEEEQLIVAYDEEDKADMDTTYAPEDNDKIIDLGFFYEEYKEGVDTIISEEPVRVYEEGMDTIASGDNNEGANLMFGADGYVAPEISYDDLLSYDTADYNFF